MICYTLVHKKLCLLGTTYIGKRGDVMFHILVVDDYKNTRQLFKAILEAENYTVTLAVDGEEALDYLDKEKFDLAIVDIMMPKIDGYEFTKILRESDSTLPILMVTAKQLPADRKLGYLAGTDDYMTKPVDEEELLIRITSLLRRAQIMNERKICIGKVEVDYDTYTVTREDEKQTLPQKEFLLLYKLLSYPDKIFTRIQLMDEIWGMETKAGWETITVHINRLRKRFENYPEFELVSVRGLGYKAVKR